MMDPLRGHYGFLTEFAGLSEDAARGRVTEMVTKFGILEFQFYDALEGYSQPPQPSQAKWKCFFGRIIERSVLAWYTEEIARHGGRSWLYVQAMASDPGDTELQAGHSITGQHVVDKRPLLDAVVPTPAWAKRVAPRWAAWASALGFSGIHWDTLGNFKGMSLAGCDIPGFLRAALPILQEHGLAQTCNFVDGFGWDPSLLARVGWARNVIAFPYWEVWTVPDVENRFFEHVTSRAPSVFVCYPGRTAEHKEERQNKHAGGLSPLDLAVNRWKKATHRGSTYLAVGDGCRHIQTEYFPATAAIPEAHVLKIQATLGLGGG